ncbi:MAG TPA: helix-turn-helix domain-containing protein [Ramlibacter sp.]|nr:helix-turn-helix domain-containing protein [Ramlibacter sp.]
MDAPHGTQSLARSIKLLRVVATRGEIGWRLSDLAAACELDRSTAHRILTGLVKERLVQQRPDDRRYLPGPMLFELGLSLPAHYKFQLAAEAHLAPWARRMKATALLLLRSGFEFVCSVRTGPMPLPGLMIEQGTRRPLFTSSGGVAMMLAMSKAEAAEVLKNNINQEVDKRGASRLAALRKMRVLSARHGFGVNLGYVAAGVHAFAVPTRAPDGKPFAALCLMSTAEHFDESRLDEVRAELERMALLIEADAARLLFRAPATGA